MAGRPATDSVVASHERGGELDEGGIGRPVRRMSGVRRRLARLHEVDLQALDPVRLEPLIGPERMARYDASRPRRREAASAGRTILNVNSTAVGGGVAEMLQTLLAYVRGAGVDARWLVISGDADFFAITKRIHNGLYGSPGDGGPLGAAERCHYEATLRPNADRAPGPSSAAETSCSCTIRSRPGSPIGCAGRARSSSGAVTWAAIEPNEWTERSWAFLRPYLEDVDAYVVSRAAFAPPWADGARTGSSRRRSTPSRRRTSRCPRATSA